MKKILITGANGQVGRVLQQQLAEHSLTLVDLPQIDLRSYEASKQALEGHDLVIHLAWNSSNESYITESIDPDNSKMALHIYQAALEIGVPRVIMASSIHADNYDIRDDEGLLSPHRIPIPRNRYGATKVYIEALGRFYAQQGLEVACLRLGGIRENNELPDETDSVARYLTNNDLGSLVRAYIDTPTLQGNYELVYGVSNNTGRVHDVVNSVGWMPSENAADLVS